jgi:hypothetical protein
MSIKKPYVEEPLYRDLYEKVEPILVEYGLTKEQSKEAFYSQMAEYEKQILDLKLPGIKKELGIEIIKDRIQNPLKDESFLARIRKLKNDGY